MTDSQFELERSIGSNKRSKLEFITRSEQYFELLAEYQLTCYWKLRLDYFVGRPYFTISPAESVFICLLEEEDIIVIAIEF